MNYIIKIRNYLNLYGRSILIRHNFIGSDFIFEQIFIILLILYSQCLFEEDAIGDFGLKVTINAFKINNVKDVLKPVRMKKLTISCKVLVLYV